MKLIIFFLLTMTQLNAYAFDFGEAVINGQGCDSKDRAVQVEILSAQPGAESKRFDFPVQMTLEKKKNRLSERLACNLRLPIKVPNGERLLIKNMRQEIHYDLDSKAGGTIQLDLSELNFQHDLKSGEAQKGQEITITSGAHTVQTRCGADFMLSLNSSLRGTGSGEAKITTKNVTVEVTAQKCK